ncbi:SLAM family member 9-like [Suricata suricatta]|uniref:SLAM family member 9-like n=1 Tax=Suricata suricatta TaxID=37032 RepID=UPI0011555593|nr:SLAM family member 9-like [Suricata suricatta]
MLHVFPGVRGPEWVNFQDKYKERVQVLNTTTLRMDKLTLEDSGRYWARVSLTGGTVYDQYFHLSVYEPVSRPQILAEILSLTADLCKVTLECHPTGPTGAVNVSWESKGLPRELEQTGAPGPAPTPWTLALHLPLSRPSPSVTCVVSNPVDQKTATRDLGEVCGHGEYVLPEGRGLPELRSPWVMVPGSVPYVYVTTCHLSPHPESGRRRSGPYAKSEALSRISVL